MKKAQWKKPPLQRLAHAAQAERMDALEKELAIVRSYAATAEAAREALAIRVRTATETTASLRVYHTIYKFFRIVGVVIEYEGDFKHLKGADLDAFFGCDNTPASRVSIGDEKVAAAMYKDAAALQAQRPFAIKDKDF